jgi:hypothetical protein
MGWKCGCTKETRMLLDETSMGDGTSTFEGRKYNKARNNGRWWR